VPAAFPVASRVKSVTELKEALSGSPCRTAWALIVRTAGVGKSPEELEWDLNVSAQPLGLHPQGATGQRAAPVLIHQESNVIVRAIRDYLRRDVNEDPDRQPGHFERAKSHIVQLVMPRFPQSREALQG
jgi:ribonuclease E